MFGTIRKHQTWLWAVIITLTIVSFVVFGPTNTKIGNLLGGGDERLGSIDGHPITQAQFQDAIKEVNLEYLIRNEQVPDDNSATVQKDAYLKLFLVKKAKDAGIQISTAAVVARIHQVIGEAPVDAIEERLLKPNGLDLTDMDRYYRHQLAIEQLGMTASLSGKLVTPQEAETMYRLENQDIDTKLAYFSASNYMASVPMTPDDLKKFYTNQLANYRFPDQVQVDYVKFTYTNYFAAAKAALTNLEEIVNTNVQHMGTNLFHDTKTPAESKNAVRKEIISRRAQVAARQAASTFAETLDTQPKPHTLANLRLLAATNGLALHSTAPFERQYGPQEFIAPPGFAQKAFALDTNDMFAGPIIGDDGIYVIGLNQRINSYTPSFQQIEPRVTADYRYNMGLQMARQAALDLQQRLTNSANVNKSFVAVCTEAHVKPKSLAPFSVSTRTLPDDLENKVDLSMFKQVAFNTPVGKASQAAAARDGAFILYVDKQLPFDNAKMAKEMPEFVSYLRTARQNDAFNQWFNQQIRLDAGFTEAIQRVVQGPQTKSTNARRPKS